jgi:hypothetical protein
MFVKSESLPDAMQAHNLEACAIHETQISATRNQDSSYALLVQRIADPFNREDRIDIVMKDSHGFHAYAMLQDSNRFRQNIARCNQRRSLLKELDPG